jgi:hypothetical protein
MHVNNFAPPVSSSSQRPYPETPMPLALLPTTRLIKIVERGQYDEDISSNFPNDFDLKCWAVSPQSPLSLRQVF